MSDISPVLTNRVTRLSCDILRIALGKVPSLCCAAEFWENVGVKTDITELRNDVLRSLTYVSFTAFAMDVQARINLYLDGSENASGCVDILFPEGMKPETLVSFRALFNLEKHTLTLNKERGDFQW